MYTSDAVRSTLTFGYTYPELTDWNISAVTLASNVRGAINALYNPSAFGSNSTTSTVSSRRLSQATASTSKHAFSHITFFDAQSLAFNNLPMQWTIDIRVARYAFPGPFTLDFFMGEPEADPTLRPTAPHLIGSHAAFIAGDLAAMFPAGAPEGLVQGHVSLSHTLAAGLDRGLLRDLSPRHVAPLLERLLRWNARSVDGRDVDVGSLKNLSVLVSSRTVEPAARGDVFPTYGELHYWPVITKGKVGGRRGFDF